MIKYNNKGKEKKSLIVDSLLCRFSPIWPYANADTPPLQSLSPTITYPALMTIMVIVEVLL